MSEFETAEPNLTPPSDTEVAGFLNALAQETQYKQDNDRRRTALDAKIIDFLNSNNVTVQEVADLQSRGILRIVMHYALMAEIRLSIYDEREVPTYIQADIDERKKDHYVSLAISLNLDDDSTVLKLANYIIPGQAIDPNSDEMMTHFYKAIEKYDERRVERERDQQNVKIGADVLGINPAHQDDPDLAEKIASVDRLMRIGKRFAYLGQAERDARIYEAIAEAGQPYESDKIVRFIRFLNVMYPAK